MIWLRSRSARRTRSPIAREDGALQAEVEKVKRDVLRNGSMYLEGMVLQVHLTLQSSDRHSKHRLPNIKKAPPGYNSCQVVKMKWF